MASSTPLSKANASFSLAMLRKLTEEDNAANIVFSPFSISSALAMVMLGARGNTAAQISEVQFTRTLVVAHPQGIVLIWAASANHIKLSCNCISISVLFCSTTNLFFVHSAYRPRTAKMMFILCLPSSCVNSASPLLRLFSVLPTNCTASRPTSFFRWVCFCMSFFFFLKTKKNNFMSVLVCFYLTLGWN